MFNLFNSTPKKRTNFGNWILPGLGIVAGLVLLINQVSTVPQQATPVATPAAETPQDSFLPEYDSAFDAALITEPDDRSLWQIGLDLSLKLLVVIGLAYASIMGLRWLQNSKPMPNSGGVTIRVLETISLLPGKTLHLVVAGEKTLLIGATEQQLSVLSELEPVAAAVTADDDLSMGESFDAGIDAAAVTPFQLAMYRQTASLNANADLQAATEAAQSNAELQTMLESMKTGVQHIRQMVGGRSV